MTQKKKESLSKHKPTRKQTKKTTLQVKKLSLSGVTVQSGTGHPTERSNRSQHGFHCPESAAQ